jgi:hypothetical protein
MEHLNAFHPRVYSRGELSNLSLDERTRLDQEYDDVAITLKSNGELELQPMVRVQGRTGFRGDKRDAVTIRLPTNAGQLCDALVIAYSRCRK